ncbi:MAG: dihydroxyacetone kinase subunit L [Propionibacteriaceae bacterium]|jgi:dihydroxyacetone kinase-like protein|nr:dihydroxyacetone kinase subunit L [Propionibacteriaceae bacterium]
MLLDREGVRRLLDSVADVWSANTTQLNEIDSKYGDGDHGVTIGKIANLIKRSTAAWDEESIRVFLTQLSGGVMAIGGGSAGPLYGMVFDGFAAGVPADAVTIDAATVQAMLSGARAALQSISKAQIGDKTMMDALLPAVAAAEEVEGDIGDILQAANKAAAAGVEATRDMVAKFGRARSYGVQTLGTADVGALSVAMLFEGLATGIE